MGRFKRILLIGITSVSLVSSTLVAEELCGNSPAENNISEFGSVCKEILSSPENKKLCERVPAENRLQCLGGDEDASGLSYLEKCGLGLKQGILDFLKLIFVKAPIAGYKMLKSFISFLFSSEKQSKFGERSRENFNYMIALSTDSEVRTEFLDKVLDKSEKMFNAMAEFLGYKYKEFHCLNGPAKTESVCAFVSEFVIPPVVLFGFIKKLIKAKQTKDGLKKLAESDDMASMPSPVRLEDPVDTPVQAKQVANAKLAQEVLLKGAMKRGNSEEILRYSKFHAEESVKYLRENGYKAEVQRRNDYVDRYVVDILGAPKDKTVSSGIINSINSPKGTKIISKINICPKRLDTSIKYLLEFFNALDTS
ncbi:hypothetical protein N9W41_00150 [bacterium]|nr:hypothetical protein [bacterium]